MAIEAELVSVPTSSVGLAFPLVVVTAVLCAIYYWQQSTRKFQLGNKVPGPRPIPVIGNALDIITCKNPHGNVNKS